MRQGFLKSQEGTGTPGEPSHQLSLVFVAILTPLFSILLPARQAAISVPEHSLDPWGE